MQCPVDGETLVMTERSGVEIDYCPKCRGVWLDRGELDKIIDRAADSGAARPVTMPPPASAPAQSPQLTSFPPQPHPAAAPDLHGQPRFDPQGDRRRDDRGYDDRGRDRDDRRADYREDRYRSDDRDRDRRYDDDDNRYRKKRKRDSFLSDLFDFD